MINDTKKYTIANDPKHRFLALANLGLFGANVEQPPLGNVERSRYDIGKMGTETRQTKHQAKHQTEYIAV